MSPKRASPADAHSFTWHRLARLAGRAMSFRCPNCGARPVRVSWLKRLPGCPTCGLRFDRGESDYFIGAYMLNLIAAELLLALGLVTVLMATWPDPPWTVIQYAGAVLLVLAPLVFYPFTEMLWLACDIAFRPLSDAEMAWHRGANADARDLPHR